MAFNREYWKKYYEKNKDRLNEIKKLRYKTDADYREAIRLGAKLRSTLYKASKKLAKVDKVRTVYGVEETPMTLKSISRMIGVDYCILRKWKLLGFIPKPLYKKKKRDIYTESQAKYFRDFIEELKKNERYLTYVDLKVFLKRVWALPYKGKEFSKELISKIFNEVSKYEEVKDEK